MFSNRSTHVSANGLTLIELMVVLALIGILATIAYPSYQAHLSRSYRSQAQTDLLTMQLYLEKHYDASNAAYVNGYNFNVVSNGVCTVCLSESLHYSYQVVSSSVYTLKATAMLDTNAACAELTLAQSGLASPLACW